MKGKGLKQGTMAQIVKCTKYVEKFTPQLLADKRVAQKVGL